MSHFLDRLKFLGKAHETFAGGHGAVTLEDRQWGKRLPQPLAAR